MVILKVTCYYRLICTVFATSLTEGGLSTAYHTDSFYQKRKATNFKKIIAHCTLYIVH